MAIVREFKTEAKLWKGEAGRKPEIRRTGQCCGTCSAAEPNGAVAYMSVSDEQGNGVTIHLFDEEAVRILEQTIGARKAVFS